MSWRPFFAIPLFAGILYPLIYLGYRRMLKYKRDEIISLMSKGRAFQSYLAAFSALSDELPKNQKDERRRLVKTMEGLFNIYYDWRTFLFPLLICTVLSFGACSIALAKAGAISTWLPDGVMEMGKRLPNVALSALAGAYVWGLYEMVRNFMDLNLTPTRIHLIWLRLLISPMLGYLIALPLNDPSKLFAGFVVGAFPLSQLIELVQARGTKLLNIESSKAPTEPPTLQNIQGMTKETLDTLNGECIYSTQHLAQADPIKLLLRTRLEWKVILDLIDQACLFNYVGERIVVFRSCGFRGAIELASLKDDLKSRNKKTSAAAGELLGVLADSLNQDVKVVENLIGAFYDDVQVDFIWELWGDAT